MVAFMAHEHYFSESPSGDKQLQNIQVRLANKDVTVTTSGGIFSPEHIDAGTQVLLYSAPVPPDKGTFLDIGCGWGPLALTMALESPGATVWGIDINERARDLTELNARQLGLSNIQISHPEGVPADLKFDLIWSNPPIRVGKSELHAILAQWLPRLSIGGKAYLVVAKHLGADSLEKWLKTTFATTHTVERTDTRKGFRVLCVTHQA